MLKIIEPTQFKTIPWKNGQGETTELAINKGGALDNFDWRLSIATVVNDGFFSDFSGYHRNLVLIEGNGISLQHDDKQLDVLKKVLEISSFSGSCKTYGKLSNGTIKDFNIMTSNNIVPHVHCYHEPQQVVIRLSTTSVCFAYSLTDDITVERFREENTIVPPGSLAKVSAQHAELNNDQLTVVLTGKNMIIVQLETV